MSRFVTALVMIAMALSTAGCGRGDGLLRTKGRLLKDGKPFVPDAEGNIQITFVPIPADGKPASNYYYAQVDDQTATYWPAGGNLKGVPPGKYRVAVELMDKKKDKFKGQYDTQNSPFVFDVDASTKEIVIDLDKPPPTNG